MRAELLLCLLTALIVTAPDLARAGAWTQDSGKGIVIRKTTYDRAPAEFDAQGYLSVARDFSKLEGQTYLEVGLTDALTFLTAPTYQSLRDRAGDFSEKGLAFTEVGTRVRLWGGTRGVLSLQALAIVPGNMPGSRNAVLSSGKTDYELRAATGWNFHFVGFPAFLDLSGGYRKRGGAVADEWRADTVLGLRIRPRWQMLTQTFSIFGTGSYQLHKVQTSLVYEVSDQTSVEFGLWRALVGRDVLQEEAVFIAIWYRI